jgi:signal transduction histidine kinase/CHASE2 domain-containing sensor protein
MNSAEGKAKLTEPARRATWLIAIVLFSTVIGIGISWRLPELDAAARDWMVRTRGAITPPAEIVIVAIDEPSIARLGRFPWPRSITARLLDRISAARPKAIALDLLYSEPTEPDEDEALAAAIARAGNVVVATQLIRTTDERNENRIAWLRPLPEIESAAAGTGHVNIATGFDGVARLLLLRQSDDEGQAFWAMAIEAIRIAMQVKSESLRELPDALQIGARTIPVNIGGDEVPLGPERDGSQFERLRPARLILDYVGPARSFSPQTYSFSDVLEGRVSAEKLRDKYVLIGATAAALGDRLATPFAHTDSAIEAQPAELMSGVEILANSLHTILRERFYREVPDWLTALFAALAAAAVCFSLTISQGRLEAMKQILVMTGLALAAGLTSYLAFSRWLILLSVVPLIVSGSTAALLTLLRRSLIMSAGLDARISEMALWGNKMAPPSGGLLSSQSLPNDPTRSIAELCPAWAVAITAHESDGQARLIACHGASFRTEALNGKGGSQDTARSVSQAMSQDGPASSYFEFDYGNHPDQMTNRRVVTLRLGEGEQAAGELILAYADAQRPTNETLMLCREIAASFLATNQRLAAHKGAEAIRRRFNWWPRGAEWKERVLAGLEKRMITHSFFVERALRSIEDGLIIASAEGCITFANPRAAAILGVSERGLIGADIFLGSEWLNGTGQDHSLSDHRSQKLGATEILFRLLVERLSMEREITIGDSPVRHYMLRMSAVSERPDGTGPVLGIVASFSDITKQQELQQAKNDVMALVSHELRTPLTAIQAISEVLTRFDVEHERRREMHLAINDEAKRLARMIDEYLDLTRLESGARPLRLEPVRMAQLLERTLLLLDPVAANSEIRIVRRFAPNLPAVMADPDLIGRAVTNLVANAVKFSSPRRDVLVEADLENNFLRIAVRDQGCGIPRELLPHIFEKFYRVPRLEDADAHGTGLGLAFVRDIAELHGGRITVESEVGVGSLFTLRLPLKRE